MADQTNDADEAKVDEAGGDAVDVLQTEHGDLQRLFARVSSPDEDRPAVLKELLQRLAAHVAMEKELLVPVLEDRVDGGAALAEAVTADHDRAERILILLERRKVNSPDVPELVTELLDLVDAHVATASDAIFPALRSALDGAELDELGAAMISDERDLLTHPHPGLPDSGPLATVTRKVAAAVDRVRDASTDIGRTAT